jgi:hypothetical protein
MTEVGKQQAASAVATIVSEGWTNIVEGLEDGLKYLLENRKNDVGYIMLLSDGEATHGQKTPSGLQNQVKSLITDYQQRNPELLPFNIIGVAYGPDADLEMLKAAISCSYKATGQPYHTFVLLTFSIL